MSKQQPADNKPPVSAPEEPDQVGYRRPPKHTRFKKGQSGNRKGRPKRRHNLQSELRKVYTDPVVVNEDGKRRRVPAAVAIALLQIQRALNADVRAAEATLKHVKEFGLLDQAPESSVCDMPRETLNDEITREDISALSNEELDLIVRTGKMKAEIRARRSKPEVS